jgi:hypothetical protein
MRSNHFKQLLVSFVLVVALLCLRPCLALMEFGGYQHPSGPQLLEFDLATSQAVNVSGRAAWTTCGPAVANSFGSIGQLVILAARAEVEKSSPLFHRSARDLSTPTRAPPHSLPV